MAANPPKGKIDTQEGLMDAFAALGIGQDVLARVKAIPANPKAVDYARALGAAEDGPQMKLAQLIDQVRAQLLT